MKKNNPKFIMLPYEILENNDLTLRQIRVLMAIYSWKKRGSEDVRICRKMLSEKTGYSLNRISEITTQLKKLGLLEKTKNLGKSQWSEYQIKGNTPTQTGNPKTTQNGKFLLPKTVTPPTQNSKEHRYRYKNNNINIITKKQKNTSSFQIPKIDEVINYFGTLGCVNASTEAHNFYDYNESRGWIIGSRKMKDWQASCRYWYRRSKEMHKPIKVSQPKVQPILAKVSNEYQF